VNKNPGLLQKSGTRVGLGKQRGAAIRQKIKKDRRYRYTFAFLKTTLPQIFLFFLFLVFFLFFTIATLLLSNGRREKLLSVKSGRFGKVGVASLRGPHG